MKNTDWVRIKDIPGTFGIGKTKASQLMQEMKACGKLKGGVDYRDISPKMKFVNAKSFDRFLNSKHLAWLKES